MTYSIKKKRRSSSKDLDSNDSSWRFSPLGSRVMALSIKCDSLAVRIELREE